MSLGEHESDKGIHRLFACLCVAAALPQLPEDHTSLIISESCLLFSHSFRNSSQSMELVRNTGVRSPPLSGRVPAAVSSHSAAVQAPQRRTSWSIPPSGSTPGRSCGRSARSPIPTPPGVCQPVSRSTARSRWAASVVRWRSAGPPGGHQSRGTSPLSSPGTSRSRS